MTPPRSPQHSSARALRVLATVVAGIIALLLMNSMRTGSPDGSALATQSLLTLPESGSPTSPTEVVPTTPPLALPTLAPVATATVVPTATTEPAPAPTSAPTATPMPAATAAPTQVPLPQADEPETVVASETVVATEAATAEDPPPTIAAATVAPEPTATLVPLPTPTPEPLVVEPTATAIPLPTATAVPVQSIADLELYVLGRINQIRANAGLNPLALDANISLISRDWSQQMADGGFFEHRPGDQLSAMLPSGWRRWGENIASAGDIIYAQSSLERSPGHYENMVGPFTHLGIGVYVRGSLVYVTQNFALYE